MLNVKLRIFTRPPQYKKNKNGVKIWCLALCAKSLSLHRLWRHTKTFFKYLPKMLGIIEADGKHHF